MVCFLSLSAPWAWERRSSTACPSEVSRGCGHLEPCLEDTLLTKEMKLSRAWQILLWLFYDNTLSQGDDPRHSALEQ